MTTPLLRVRVHARGQLRSYFVDYARFEIQVWRSEKGAERSAMRCTEVGFGKAPEGVHFTLGQRVAIQTHLNGPGMPTMEIEEIP